MASHEFFFFNDTATTEIYTLSLHDALPIFSGVTSLRVLVSLMTLRFLSAAMSKASRSEEHTSELQSRQYLVCRLLLEKKKLEYRLLLDKNNRRRDQLRLVNRTTTYYSTTIS